MGHPRVEGSGWARGWDSAGGWAGFWDAAGCWGHRCCCGVWGKWAPEGAMRCPVWGWPWVPCPLWGRDGTLVPGSVCPCPWPGAVPRRAAEHPQPRSPGSRCPDPGGGFPSPGATVCPHGSFLLDGAFGGTAEFCSCSACPVTLWSGAAGRVPALPYPPKASGDPTHPKTSPRGLSPLPTSSSSPHPRAPPSPCRPLPPGHEDSAVAVLSVPGPTQPVAGCDAGGDPLLPALPGRGTAGERLPL